MSAEAVTVVLHHSRSEGTAKLVLWGIANHHSDAGAWPSVATLAKYAAVSERRVQQIIRELSNLGEIAIEEQGGLGQAQYKTNRYHILIQCPADCDGSLNHKTGVKSGASGVQSSAVRGEIQSQPGVKPISPEPNKELNKNLTVQSEQFNDFWSQYPKREGKKPAFKAFASALSRATFEDIIAGVIRYQSSDKVQRGFVMLASRWLNEDHWEDNYTPAPDSQAAEKANQRRDRELQRSNDYLAEIREQEKHASAPTLCQHGKNLALCLPCSKSLG
jgi:hypothetical protein